jgi:hypothetical protein
MSRKLKIDRPECPSPPGLGIHEGYSFGLYRDWPLLSQSTLKWALLSPQHLKAAIDGLMDLPDSAALRFGRALHCRILEPERFKTNWKISDGCCMALKSGAKKGQPCGCEAKYYLDDNGKDCWFCGKHSGGIPVVEPEDYVTHDQLDSIDAMWQGLREHAVLKLLRQHGGCEVSVVWECEGVRLKARLDKLIWGGAKLKSGRELPPTIVDLKKTRLGGGDLDRFSHSIRAYDYDMQAAFYVDAVKFHMPDKPAPEFIWVAVEDELPHAVSVVRATNEAIEIGRAKYRAALAIYNRCRRTGEWPGYSNDIQDCVIPQWYVDKELGQ